MVKAGRMQTEFGTIPEDWTLEQLGNLGSFKNGINKGSIDFGHGSPFVNLLDVFGVSSISDSQSLGLVNSSSSEQKTYNLERGDVLFVRSSVKPEGVGLTTVVLNDLPGVVYSGFLIRFRDYGKLATGFKKYCFWEEGFRSRLVANSTISANTNINQDSLKKLTLIFPESIAEQRMIAETLFDVDGLIVGLNKLIAKKRAVKQAAMQQLLTGKTRLPGFGNGRGYKQTEIGLIPEDWDVKPLITVSTLNGRIGWQGLKQSEFNSNPDDPFLITGMNFKDGEIRWDEVYHIPMERYKIAPSIQLRSGDVLMTKDGTIGKLLYVDEIPYPGKASLNSHLLLFRPIGDQYIPKFLFYQLGFKPFLDHIELNKSGSTFFGITQEAIGKYSAFLPPIPEQTAIAEVLTDMDTEITALEARRAKTQAIKQGMMQELLTGRTRLL